MQTAFKLSLGFAALTLTLPAAAQDKDADGIKTPAIVADLFACRDIVDDEARLACFDREVGVIQSKQQREEIVIADKEEVRETRRGLFGFSLPKIGLFRDDDEEDELDRVQVTIASARKMSNGRVSFTTDTGARWIQVDNTPILRDPKPGDNVTI